MKAQFSKHWSMHSINEKIRSKICESLFISLSKICRILLYIWQKRISNLYSQVTGNTILQSPVYSHWLTPNLSFMLMSAPLWTKYLTVSTCPPETAKCRGVYWWKELKKQVEHTYGLLLMVQYSLARNWVLVNKL